jgi:hypothetical protein
LPLVDLAIAERAHDGAQRVIADAGVPSFFGRGDEVLRGRVVVPFIAEVLQRVVALEHARPAQHLDVVDR